MDDIYKLAEILRDNGDKVLNNEIVEQRDAMKTSFHIMNSSNSKTELFSDIQFLHDFIEKSPSLKLTPNIAGQICNDFVDISACKSLKFLEVYKLNINLILGIENLRRRLQFLICIRSVNFLKDILEKCGGDGSDGHIWNELKEATFTHNSLENIDSSIEYVPWLSSLDLSYNNIENAEMLSCLSNLKYLNLGYNKLSKVPTFTGQICSRLQVLIVSNNFIEDIQEVMKLINLCELDLTENCLIEHTLLVPLSYLATLQCLNLEGNPISYHPQHRTRSCCYLHMNTATVKFVLDGITVNKVEQRLIGSLHPKQLHRPPSQPLSLTASISDSAVVAERNRRIRHARISDDNISPELDIIESIATLFTLSEPFETKRQLESLHKEYIKSLYSKSSSLSADHDYQSSLPLTSTPYGSNISVCVRGTNLKNDDKSDAASEPTTYLTAHDTIEKVDEQSDIYSNKPEEPEEVFEPSDDEELESGESNIFLASVKGCVDDIIVILTKTHLTEKDPITMKGLGRFALDTLTTCEKVIEPDVLYIYVEFDTVRSDRFRYYRFANEEGGRFFERLKNIIDNKPPEKDIFIVYRCMKCSTQFAVEKQKTMHQQAVKCLSCDSDLVVEDDS